MITNIFDISDMLAAIRRSPFVSANYTPAERAAVAYVRLRREGKVALVAFAGAKRAAAAPGVSHGETAPGAYSGTDAVRHVTKPAAAGLRLVGTSGEVGRLIGSQRLMREAHGYFVDSFGGDTSRGVVFQLPARGRRAVYVAGHTDPHNDGSVIVDMSETFLGERGAEPADDYQTLFDAASRADSLAERYAEECRDCDAAWQAGSRWRDHSDDMQRLRYVFRELHDDLRRSPALPDAICAAVRHRIKDILASRERARTRRAELRSGNAQGFLFCSSDPDQWAAFCDGAGGIVGAD